MPRKKPVPGDPLRRAVLREEKMPDLIEFKSKFAADVNYSDYWEYPLEIRNKFLEKLAEDPNRKIAAAHFVGVSMWTVNKWKEKYPEFASAFSDICESATDEVEAYLHEVATGKKDAKQPQVTGALGYLNANRSEKYDPKRIAALAGSGGDTTTVIFVFNKPEKPNELTADVTLELTDGR